MLFFFEKAENNGIIGMFLQKKSKIYVYKKENEFFCRIYIVWGWKYAADRRNQPDS